MMTFLSTSLQRLAAASLALEATDLKPHVVMTAFMLIGAAGLVTGGLVAEDLPMRPPLGFTMSASERAGGDEAFVREAAEGGATEVAMAELAETRADDESVKHTATEIGADHVKANQALQLLAAEKGWQLPGTPGAEGEVAHARLEGLSGAEFDRAYIDQVVRHHHADIASFEWEVTHGSDEAVKRFASETLPALREHLEMSLKAQRALQTARR
jgi:predicted outer membrane protein